MLVSMEGVVVMCLASICTTHCTYLWILHEVDTQPRRPFTPYNLPELIIIPQETDQKLIDPRLESASISSEIDHILNQEYDISASLSELDLMLRQSRVRRCTTTKY